MSDPLPTEIEVGDAHALRTFAVKDGRMTSIAQRGAHWKDGKCLAVCLTYPEDADHEVPSDDCTCGVYAFWTVAELLGENPAQEESDGGAQAGHRCVHAHRPVPLCTFAEVDRDQGQCSRRGDRATDALHYPSADQPLLVGGESAKY